MRFLIIMMVLLLYPFMGWAQSQQVQDITKIEVLPSGASISDDVFVQNTKLFSNVPLEDKRLSYQVRLPKDWDVRYEEGDDITALSANLMTVLARYFGPPLGNFRPLFNIEAIRLKEETFAEDWVRHYLLANSFTLRAMEIKSHREVEALYISLEGEETYATRARVIITDNILLLIRFSVPANAFNTMSALQAKALNSFVLETKPFGSVEKARRFALLDALSFYYPQSWVVRKPNLRSFDRLSVQIHRLKDGNIIFGNIAVFAVKKDEKTTAAKEINQIIADLKKEGWSIVSLLERRSARFSERFKPGQIEVYDINYSEDILDQELWFAYTENQSHYFFFKMLTPKREIARNDWSVNNAVFSLLLSSIR